MFDDEIGREILVAAFEKAYKISPRGQEVIITGDILICAIKILLESSNKYMNQNDIKQICEDMKKKILSIIGNYIP